MFPRSRRSDAERAPDPLPLALRAGALGLVAAVALGVLVFRLWALQVLHSDQNVAQAVTESVRTTRVAAERGIIFDASGRRLVTNSEALALQLNPSALPALANPHECDGLRQSDVAALRRKPACAVLGRIAFVLNSRLWAVWGAFQEGWAASQGATPITLADSVTFNQVAYVREHQPEFPGVQFQQVWQRDYPLEGSLGPIAPNLLGYVGAISPADLKNPYFHGLPRSGTIGKMGVEESYDSALRGIDGQVAQSFNAFNQPVGPAYMVRAPQPGADLKLTISARMQLVAQNAIRYGISIAHQTGGGGAYSNSGAIVAINPQNGAIVAMASLPLWRNSVTTAPPPQKAFAQLVSPKNTAAPMVDRAFGGGGFPAGSTFKPVVATAAWENGVIGPGTSLDCPGYYESRYATDHHKFFNWNPNDSGVIGLSTALEISCDTFFYQLGDDFYGRPHHGTGYQHWLNLLGYGSAPQLDTFGVGQGLVPTPSWKAQYYRWGSRPCRISPYCTTPAEARVLQVWEPGDDINMSIGQGFLLVTPLQMAIAFSALENGGKVVRPHVVQAILNPATLKVERRIAPRPVRNLHLSPTLLSQVDQGLYLATHSVNGTSSAVFGNFSPTVYGKTGTAQVPQDCPSYLATSCSDAWWVGWAQQGGRQLVVAAFIKDGGEGGVAAAPAALRVFEAYFHEKLTSVVGRDVSH